MVVVVIDSSTGGGMWGKVVRVWQAKRVKSGGVGFAVPQSTRAQRRVDIMVGNVLVL